MSERRGLLAMDIIVCVYAIVQVVLSLVKLCTTGAFMSTPTKGGMITFVCDLVLLCALIATAAAAADTRRILSSEGSCNSYMYCQKATASIAFSFLAFSVLAVLTALYPVRLLRMSK